MVLIDPITCRISVFELTCSHRQPWLIRGMAAGSAAEVLEPAEVPGLPVKEEERPSKPVTPKYLIGKTQEELEDIVLSLGEVSFFMLFKFPFKVLMSRIYARLYYLLIIIC